jgi:release factor glutamine methyltransferase
MRILTESEDAKIDMLGAQRAMGQPIAYLLMRREFYGRDFAVGPDVLIPRPETETLIEAALPRLAPKDTCLDLGTGSGAIAVTIACQRPEARVVATDTSEAALRVARRNAGSHHCAERIEFLRGSWYEPLAGRRFDLIVSNPPYVPSDDDVLPRTGLRRAWDAGSDGRILLDRIAREAPAHLSPGGTLWLVHSSVCDASRTLASLEAAGLQPSVAEAARGPLGPLLAARAPMLAARGLIDPDADEEELVAIRAVAT